MTCWHWRSIPYWISRKLKLNPAKSKNSHSWKLIPAKCRKFENLVKKVYKCKNNELQRSEFAKFNSRKIAIRENILYCCRNLIVLNSDFQPRVLIKNSVYCILKFVIYIEVNNDSLNYLHIYWKADQNVWKTLLKNWFSEVQAPKSTKIIFRES